ncbi:MAG: aldehyde dehydrogenase family protein [Candidatus Delongbacteria bacterium]|nr:aldehyde dehydrogenase family protein [Candidatus Delongbacteria bacterium]
MLIDGKWLEGVKQLAIRSPWDDAVVGNMARGSEVEVEAAIGAADRAAASCGSLPVYERAAILERVKTGIETHSEEFARLLALEAGKPLHSGRAEVQRAVHTFELAVEECKRLTGEIIPLDLRPWGAGRTGFLVHEPLGPIASITPFNFPLNLVAHKLAPAMAAGNSIVHRPATQTPFSSVLLVRLIEEAGWPAGGINLLTCPAAAAAPLATDPRLQLLTFTGSPAVGWGLQKQAERKRVALELGGNAGVIVHSDCDLEYAAKAVVAAAFGYAGQSCIAVQRVLVEERIRELFEKQLLKEIELLRCGDPLEETTTVGPMINLTEAVRAENWIEQALAEGARLLTGGKREGNLLYPTVLTDTTRAMQVNCDEIFAPVMTLESYGDFATAVEALDDSRYGLQAGVFTQDLRRINLAVRGIKVGGIIINDVPTWRIDHMPYGGIKDSGNTREGVRWALREMTREKFIAVRW